MLGFTVWSWFAIRLTYWTLLGASLVAGAKPQCKKVVPGPGANFQCGVVGELQEPGQPDILMADPQIVASVEDCALLCSRRVTDKKQDQDNLELFRQYRLFSYCQSFYFDTQASVCQLLLEGAKKAAKPTNKGTLIFNDHQCYDCGPTCDPSLPYGTQVLDNGDFESDLFGPWYTRTTKKVRGHNSAQACYIGYGGVAHQSVNLCQDQLYALEFDYMLAGKISRNHPEFRVNLGDVIYEQQLSVLQYENHSDQSWQRRRIYYRVSGNHTGPLFTYTNRYGPHYTETGTIIDNVVMFPVPKPSPKPGAKSLLKNSGFETGSIEPWQIVAYKQPPHEYIKVVRPGLSGSNYALRWHYPHPQYASSITQNVTTTPNTTYLFSADVSVIHQPVKLPPWNLELSFAPVGNTFSGVTYEFSLTRGNYTISIPVVAYKTRTRVHLDFFSNQSNDTFYLDSISLKEIQSNQFF